MGPMVARQIRREQDENRDWLPAPERAPSSYRAPARGGLMMTPPTTAMITAITTIPIVSIVFTLNAPIRWDAGGDYSSSRRIAAVQYKQASPCIVG